MSGGHKLSTEEESTEILLDHIAKNTRLGTAVRSKQRAIGAAVTLDATRRTATAA